MVFIIDPQQSGLSGNMMIGAFVDLGVNPKELKNVMEDIAGEFGDLVVNFNKVNKSGIESTYCNVEVSDEPSHRKYIDLIKRFDEIQKETSYSDKIFIKSKEVFKSIALAESKIHGNSLDEVHFHEVGACDAVADVIGAVYAYYKLNLDKDTVIGLPVSVGGGNINSSHGRIPVPAPATLEILKDVNIQGGPVNTEIATPTGSALYVNFCDKFEQFQPLLNNSKIGYGAGTKDFDFPNVIRFIQGENIIEKHKIEVIETNIDHLSGEELGFLFDKLISEGASDVIIVPVIMKKNRPGHLLKVISRESKTDHLLNIIFKETGSLGIRVTPMTHRGVAKREFIKLPVKIDNQEFICTFKLSYIGDELLSYRPEYEDVKKISLKTNKSLNIVMDILTSKILNHLDGEI